MSKTLRISAVSEKTGLSAPTIYRLMAKGEFPKNVKLTGKAVGWHEHEIDEWIDSRPSGDGRGEA